MNCSATIDLDRIPKGCSHLFYKPISFQEFINDYSNCKEDILIPNFYINKELLNK